MGRLRAAAATMVTFALAACAGLRSAEPPDITLSDLRWVGGGLLEQQLQVALRVGNPNNFELPLEGLTFELHIEDRPFARGYSNERVTVPRLGETVVTVAATATTFDLFQQILTLGQDKGGGIAYRLSGKAYLEGWANQGVPYERSGRLQFLPEAEPGSGALIPL